MLNLKLATSEVRNKIELYFTAVDLFKHGKSFPRVVKILNETKNNTILINYIAEKAQHNAWEKIYKESKQMLDDSIPLMDIKTILKEKDGDDEVVDFICEYWFQMRLTEMGIRGFNGIETGFKSMLYGAIFFIPLYSITSKWYILVMPGLFIFTGIALIILTSFLKILNLIIHKINNEPAKNFIPRKIKKYP